MAGFVKFYRGLLDHHVVHKDNDYLAVWMYLLLNANHDPGQCEFNYETITLQPGQLVRGRKQISVKAIVNESKVERILNRFESEQMIEQLKSPQKRLITVLNWSSYQKGKQPIEQPNEQHMNNQRTTDEQHMNTNKKERSIKNESIKEKSARSPVIYGIYGNVKLTEDEYKKLGDLRGEYVLFLDEYIEEKGYKSKNHNLAIRRWVIKAVEERNQKSGLKTKGHYVAPTHQNAVAGKEIIYIDSDD